MDTLILTLTGVCQQITRIAATRVVNASGHRPSLLKRLGIGLSPEAFSEEATHQRVGLVGIVDSVAFLAHVLQWRMEGVKERFVPVIANRASAPCAPAGGAWTSMRHTTHREKHRPGEREVISLDLRMYLEAENARDTIYIEGIPTLESTMKALTWATLRPLPCWSTSVRLCDKPEQVS